jgi:hypothetical protein
VRYASHVAITALLASGCNSLLGIDDLHLVDAGSGDTVHPDVPVDQPPGAFCYGTYLSACFATEPTGAVTLSGTVDTATDSRCTVITQAGGPDVCAIAGQTISVTADTTVVGARPLMLVGTTSITVGAKLDVGSTRTRTGAGGNSALCAPAVNGMTTVTLIGASGASGGSFLSMGGGGGAGNGTGAGMATTAQPAQTTTVLRGGCPGGAGGNTPAPANGVGGAGGAGGGAVYLYAGQTITVTNKIKASGGAGAGGSTNGAAGGAGGSGGMVVLEAQTLTLTGAEINANGGGGGEGTRTSPGAPGQEDRDWDDTPDGGSGLSTEGGDGGDGAIAAMPAKPGMAGGGGGGGGAAGGGGGGGIGAIRTKGTVTGGSFSPARTPF